MAKKLPMKQIKKEYSKYDEYVDVTFEEDGEEYYVRVFPYFKPEKINGLIQRFYNNLKEYERLKIDFKDEHIPARILYECIVTFTSLTTPKNIKDDMSYFIQLINTHYFKEITDHFIDDEVAKVWEKIMQTMAESQKIEKMVSDMQDEIQNLDLKSPELRERLQGSKKRIPEA